MTQAANLAAEGSNVNSSGVLQPAGGGTGITALGTGVATALGVNVGTAGAPVVNGGALGTPSSGTLTNCTGLPGSSVSGNISGNAANVTGTVAVANGGTGATTLTANSILLGNGTSAFQVVAAGTSGQLLQSNGASAPTWVDASSAIKAWANWNGNSGASPVVRASLNISSITRTAAGAYTVSFTSALTDANYAIAGTGQLTNATDAAQNINIAFSTTPTSSSVQITYKQGNTSGGYDSPILSILVAR